MHPTFARMSRSSEKVIRKLASMEFPLQTYLKDRIPSLVLYIPLTIPPHAFAVSE